MEGNYGTGGRVPCPIMEGTSEHMGSNYAYQRNMGKKVSELLVSYCEQVIY